MPGILPLGKTQFFDNNGAPLAGGSIYFYALGTTNFANTYQDINLTILNTNPVILDSAGRAQIWGNTNYTVVAEDQNGNQVWQANSSSPSNRGSLWSTGSGAPTVTTGAATGDQYLDTASGNVWTFEGSSWVQTGNIQGTRGSLWYEGSGAPGTITSALQNDQYLDTASGNVWQYNGGAWALTFTLIANAAVAAAASAASAAASAAAATSAIVTAGIFASAAAGIAGTTSGKYFYVTPSTVANGMIDLYLNSSGTAVYQNTQPTAASVTIVVAKTANLSVRKFSSLTSATLDVNSLVMAYQTNAGVSFNIGLPTAQSAFPTLKNRKFSGLSRAVIDVNGLVMSGTQSNGADILTAKASNAFFKPGTAAKPGPLGSLFMIPQYGESTSIGLYGGGPLTTVQPYNNLMFSTGVLQNTGTGYAQTAFSPAVEATLETGLCAMVNTLSALTGGEMRFMVGAFGMGGQTIAELSKGTTPYTDLINSITNAFNVASANGDVLNVPMIPFIIGANDENARTSILTMTSSLVTLAANLNSDIQGITGQTNSVLLFVVQDSSWTGYNQTVPLAALGIAAAPAASSLIRVVSPMYYLAPTFEGPALAHPTNFGYRHMGLDIAKAYLSEFGQQTPWSPLTCLYAYHVGSTVVAKFYSPSGTPISLSAENVTDPNGAKGFEIIDSAGNPTINSVSVIAPDTVRFQCSRALSGSEMVLRAAYTGVSGNAGGATTGPRCLLHDGASIPNIYADYNSQPYNTNNWCCTFSIGIN